MLSETELALAKEIIAENNHGPASLIQVLTIVQEKLGYLPQEVQELVASSLAVPLSRVYEVTSFYARFSTEKKGRYEIAVCLGTACYIKGALAILDSIKEMLHIDEGQTTDDGIFTLAVSRCIGACALAPAMTINGEVYGMLNKDKVKEIITAKAGEMEAMQS